MAEMVLTFLSAVRVSFCFGVVEGSWGSQKVVSCWLRLFFFD